MLSKDCKSCTYCLWVVGIGQGVRCKHIENQKYKGKESEIPIIISYVPNGCLYYERKQNGCFLDEGKENG
jgi:hypothetical protein